MKGFGVGCPRIAARTGAAALVLILAACGSSKPIKTLEDTQSTSGEVRETANDGAESARSGDAAQSDGTDDVAVNPSVEPTELASSTEDTTVSESEAEVAALPPVDDDPDSFLSLGTREIEARLGTPARIRREGQAEIHQYRGEYRGAGCLFDLFLYPDGDAASVDAASVDAASVDSGELRVAYVELRGDSLTKAERRNCLAEMLRARLRVG